MLGGLQCGDLGALWGGQAEKTGSDSRPISAIVLLHGGALLRLTGLASMVWRGTLFCPLGACTDSWLLLSQTLVNSSLFFYAVLTGVYYNGLKDLVSGVGSNSQLAEGKARVGG